MKTLNPHSDFSLSDLGEVPKAEGVVDFYCHKAALVIEVDGDGFSLTPILTTFRRDESPLPLGEGRVRVQ